MNKVKRLKRFLAVVMSFIMMIACMADIAIVGAAEESSGEFSYTDEYGITYECNTYSGECTLKSVSSDVIGDLVIPSGIEIHGKYYLVVGIGSFAFSGCNGLNNITIPDSVTSIGNFAFFACGGLISVTIPDSVKSIGTFVFRNCANFIIYCHEGSVAESYAQETVEAESSISYSIIEEETQATEAPMPADTERPATEAPTPAITERPAAETPTPAITERPAAETPTPVITERPAAETPTPVITVQPSTVTATPIVTVQPSATAANTPAGTVPATKSGVTSVSQLTVTNVAVKFIYKKIGYLQKSAVKITWEQNSVSQGYKILRCTGDSEEYTEIKTIQGNGTISYTDSSVKKGVKYSYCVVAYGTGENHSTVTGEQSESASITVNKKVLKPQISVTKKGKRLILLFKKAEGTKFQAQYRMLGKKKWVVLKNVGGSLKKNVTASLLTTGFQLRVRTGIKVSGKMTYSAWSKSVTIR